MGYSFTFGRAVVDRDDETGSVEVAIEPPACDPDVHNDSWEMIPAIGSPERSPSYRSWCDVLDQIPSLRAAMETGEAWAKWCVDYTGLRSDIPVSVFAPFFDSIEKDAMQAPDWAAARALWFIRWGRKVQELYGEWAYFSLPGEWA